MLMVCLGNICRSPLAEGIMKREMSRNDLEGFVDSAGTSGWHQGEAPDTRSVDMAAKHGIDISQQTSRKITSGDLDEFDIIYVMDNQNYRDVMQLCINEKQRGKIRRLLDQEIDKTAQVPDPYFEGGFEHVYNLIESACRRICHDLIDADKIPTNT